MEGTPALREVAFDPARDRAERVMADLRATLDRWQEKFGSDLAGFALIAWDARGDCSTAIRTSEGPIGQCLLPVYAQQALNRHIAAGMANPGVLDDLGPDAS